MMWKNPRKGTLTNLCRMSTSCLFTNAQKYHFSSKWHHYLRAPSKPAYLASGLLQPRVIYGPSPLALRNWLCCQVYSNRKQHHEDASTGYSIIRVQLGIHRPPWLPCDNTHFLGLVVTWVMWIDGQSPRKFAYSCRWSNPQWSPGLLVWLWITPLFLVGGCIPTPLKKIRVRQLRDDEIPN